MEGATLHPTTGTALGLHARAPTTRDAFATTTLTLPYDLSLLLTAAAAQ